MHALKKWKHYLMGSNMLAYTDMFALRYGKTAQNLLPRQFRWLAYISRLASTVHCCSVIGSTVMTGKTLTSLTPALAQNSLMPLVTS